MTDGHTERQSTAALINREPLVDGDVDGPLGQLRRLCSALAKTLSATGVGVSLFGGGEGGGSAAASDPQAAQLEELQFSLNEGPCIDACTSRRPVLVPDLADSGWQRWPGYTPEAYERGLRAVFAFPIQVGAATLGALDLYHDTPQPMRKDAVATALSFADAAMEVLLDREAPAATDGGPTWIGDALAPRLEVYQAQGMVMVDLGVSLGEAIIRLRAHAYAEGRSLSDVAVDVVGGRLHLGR